MTSILRAITWEFWRENRWWIIVSVSAILGLVSLVYNEPINDYDPEQMSHVTTFFMEMIGFGIFLCLSLYNKKKGRLGFPEHLFVKPIRMRSVASIRLGLAVVTAVSLYIITAWAFYRATAMRWPVALPCLYMATCIVFLHAMAWSLPAVAGLQLVFSVVGYFVLCSQYYDDLRAEDSSRTLGLLILMMLWAGVAIAGASLDRRSQRITLTTLWNRILKIFTMCLPWKTCTNSSPQRALFWFHWIRKGWILPALSVILTILGYVLLWSGAWGGEAAFIKDYFTGIFFVHLVGFPLLISLIICQQETQNQGLPTYISSLPVTNRDMLLAYLKAGLASLAMAWGVFVTGLCLLRLGQMITGKGHLTIELFSQLMTYMTHLSDLNRNVRIPGLYYLMAWSTVGLLGSMVLSGRRRVGVITFSTIFLFIAIPSFARGMGAPNIVIYAMNILWAWTFILIIIGGTFVAYIFGTLRKRIHPYLTLAALLLYIGLNIINAQAVWQAPKEILETLALLAIITRPLAPFATAPLALAWNRHR
jgi:hypothetical protein